MQPGETVTPEGSAPSQPQQPLETEVTAADHGKEQDLYNPTDPAINAPSAEMPPASNRVASMHWTALEFTAHQKSMMWYMGLAVGTMILAVVAFFVTHEILSVIVVILVGITLGFAAGRMPRTQEYGIDSTGVVIGKRKYAFSNFKSFSVGDEGSLGSIMLMPVKRFMPMVSMCFPSEKADEVISALGNYLPYDHRDAAGVDTMMRRIRF